MLKDLSDAEVGAIVRAGPLWPILLEMEKKNEKESPMDKIGQHRNSMDGRGSDDQLLQLPKR